MFHGDIFSGGTIETFFGIDFGRKLWDRELAFDPAKFTAPVLKVTYNRVASGSADSAIRLEVSAWCFDEKVISPIGFLMAKEHYAYTISTDGSFENISLPTDYPYRRLLIRGYYDSREPWHAIEAMRLDEDRLAKIPFDVKLEQYYMEMKAIWTPVQESIRYTGWGSDFVIFTTPTDYANFVQSTQSLRGLAYLTAYVRGGLVQRTYPGAGEEVNGWITGFLPHHCFDFVFGDPDDLDDLYDVTKLGNLNLRLEAGSGGGTTGEVAIQQLRRY